ncbi:hypothetical protein [Rhodococcus sp. OK302]|uniref:hypothetical protein n=1 Tax=Rhodococcus sp. OK302 TaxID=1882769 RepID=UPI000B9455DF|nr:hypothetical protein [Rhodococcus sp. OK302]OYD69679.1 hypothetical protein BDB13_3252 [Rhodococcus sp. OK302]
MYGWIWRRLPGPLPAKFVAALVLFGVVVTLLMLVVFPAIESYVPFNRVAVL